MVGLLMISILLYIMLIRMCIVGCEAWSNTIDSNCAITNLGFVAECSQSETRNSTPSEKPPLYEPPPSYDDVISGQFSGSVAMA